MPKGTRNQTTAKSDVPAPDWPNSPESWTCLGHSSLRRYGYFGLEIFERRHVPPTTLPGCSMPASTGAFKMIFIGLLGTRQGSVSQKHLDYYLDEFTFRFNRRSSKSRRNLSYRLILHAVQIGPAPYRQLAAAKQERGRRPNKYERK